jgi:hypothetical protein
MPDASAVGTGGACAWFSSRGVEAEIEGSLEFSLLGLTLDGFGHGTGMLDIWALSGWAWAVMWAQAEPPGEPPADLVGGIAVEGSPALGSGSVEGTCYFVLRRAGVLTDYRGTFVTQASSHLVPAQRPGTLALEGEMTLTLTLAPCAPTQEFPWDSSRWPSVLLAELESRLAP